MKRFTQTALTSIDSYKLAHQDMFPAGTTKVYSNFTPRSLKYLKTPGEYVNPRVVWFGLQAFLVDLQVIWKETFFDRPREDVVTEFAELVAPFCGAQSFDTTRIEQLHDLGYLPLEIKSLPEGTLVPAGIPVLTITNTVPEAFWLPNFLETWLSAELWKPATTATISYNYRKIIDHYAELTGGSKEFVMWQGHDFSSRGLSGMADVARCGAGHLLSFAGTDSVTAVQLINDVYFGKQTFVGGSVPASEHSVMTSSILVEVERLRKDSTNQLSEDELFSEAEKNVFKRFITELYPSGVISIVSDSFDFWTVINKIAPALKEEILSRTPDALGLAKVVFRPDSGDPVKIICGYDYFTVDDINDNYEMVNALNKGYDVVYDETTEKYYQFDSFDDGWGTEFTFTELTEHEVKGAIQCLWDTFGGTVNDKGFKTLNQRVGLIYGDSITMQRCDEILKLLAKKNFASDNVVFGIGSFTFQYNTRDTCGFAMKATAVEVDGQMISIFKDPKTDDGTKKSARGLLQVAQDGDTLKVNQDVSWDEEKQGLLRTVFFNGAITVEDTFADIRSRLGVI